MTWPAVDGLVAGVLTVAMISAISQDNTSMTSDDPSSDAIATGFILAGAAGVSALVGHSRVSKCRRANETYMATTYGQQTQQPYPYGYQQGYGYPQPTPAPPQGGYPQGYPQGYPGQSGQYPQQGYPQPGYPQPYPSPQPGYPQPTTYPAQPPVARPTPAPTPPPPPVRPPPVARPTPPPKPPVPNKTPEPVLGTEGDVCTTQAECASGFSCTGNVCLKAK